MASYGSPSWEVCTQWLNGCRGDVIVAPRPAVHLSSPVHAPSRCNLCVRVLQVSSLNSQNVQALFATLFARMLATIQGAPQDLAALAVQQAKDVREEK